MHWNFGKWQIVYRDKDESYAIESNGENKVAPKEGDLISLGCYIGKRGFFLNIFDLQASKRNGGSIELAAVSDLGNGTRIRFRTSAESGTLGIGRTPDEDAAYPNDMVQFVGILKHVDKKFGIEFGGKSMTFDVAGLTPGLIQLSQYCGESVPGW